jgi:MFS family permease
VILGTRSVLGPLADRVGHRKVLLPCLLLTVVGLGLLSFGGTLPWLLASALVFGTGFGTAYTTFAAHVLRHVDAGRRGAAFGGMLAAFDTGIGTGSIVTGWIAERVGFGVAFAVAASGRALGAYFAWAERGCSGAWYPRTGDAAVLCDGRRARARPRGSSSADVWDGLDEDA